MGLRPTHKDENRPAPRAATKGSGSWSVVHTWWGALRFGAGPPGPRGSPRARSSPMYVIFKTAVFF
jgi:hypothetical protein